MKVADAIDWFKTTYGDQIAAAVEETPFHLDLISAVAYQETGYIWSGLVAKGLPPAEILRLCVGDTLDSDCGRSCFPKNKADLLSAPRGREMFTIARQGAARHHGAAHPRLRHLPVRPAVLLDSLRRR